MFCCSHLASHLYFSLPNSLALPSTTCLASSLLWSFSAINSKLLDLPKVTSAERALAWTTTWLWSLKVRASLSVNHSPSFGCQPTLLAFATIANGAARHGALAFLYLWHKAKIIKIKSYGLTPYSPTGMVKETFVPSLSI